MSSPAVKTFNSVYQAQIGLVKGSGSLQRHWRVGTSKKEPGLLTSHTWLHPFHFNLSIAQFVCNLLLIEHGAERTGDEIHFLKS